MYFYPSSLIYDLLNFHEPSKEFHSAGQDSNSRHKKSGLLVTNLSSTKSSLNGPIEKT